MSSYNASMTSASSPLQGHRVLLGVSASIAAYKSAQLLRLLRRAGAEVQVVMTRAATQLIQPLTFQALSGRPVRVELFDPQGEAAMDHIELARWGERLLIAPASADLIARLAAGLADELLTTLCLAHEAPPLLAPAMNQAMWRHPATQANIARLRERGVVLLGPGEGEQACGDEGAGRMWEPEQICSALKQLLVAPPSQRLSGRRVVVTAGPTREAIDPVRFLSNRSSGRMGYAMAEAARDAGAEVTLISGPVTLSRPSGMDRIEVESAQQMLDAVLERVSGSDLFIAAAAVADYRVERPATQKLNKPRGAEADGLLALRLIENPDIAATVAALPARPFCIGFAAETESDLEARAQAKLERKGLDMIIANRVGAELGFDVEQNEATLIWRTGRRAFSLRPKRQLASELIDLIAQIYHQGISPLSFTLSAPAPR